MKKKGSPKSALFSNLRLHFVLAIATAAYLGKKAEHEWSAKLLVAAIDVGSLANQII